MKDYNFRLSDVDIFHLSSGAFRRELISRLYLLWYLLDIHICIYMFAHLSNHYTMYTVETHSRVASHVAIECHCIYDDFLTYSILYTWNYTTSTYFTRLWMTSEINVLTSFLRFYNIHFILFTPSFSFSFISVI